MTFVVCNSKFLIADKRSGTTSGVGTKNDGKKPGLSNRKAFRDDSVKIIVPDKKIFTFRHTDKKFDPNEYIVAMAMSGSYRGPVNHPVSILMELGNMQAYQTMLQNSVFSNYDFSLSALLSNGEVAFLSKDSKSENNDWRLGVYADDVKQDLPCLVQHGSGTVDTHIKDLYGAGDISLLELFFYGAHMSEHCSTDYSVYSLEHNHLYGTIIPSADEVKSAIDKIHKLLEFKDLKQHYR